VGGNHGIVVYNATSGGVVRYNRIDGPQDDCIWVYGTSDGTQVYYNICTDSYDDGIDLDSAPNCEVYDNVVSRAVDTGYVLRDTSTGVTLKNNIGFENGQPGTPNTGDEGGHEVSVTANSETGIDADYNLYYHTTAKVTATPLDWGGTSYGFADWQTNSSQDANGINDDPLFTDASNDDFTLTGSSPAINAGVDVGLTRDHAGNPIVGLPDAGAYERQ
jgi:parallel beta-helix repeat protein